MAYKDQYALAQQDGVFLQRITMAMVRTALDVYAEVNTTTGHAARAAFATKVLQNPQGWAAPFALAVAMQPAITSVSDDPSIFAATAAVWNALAGV